MRDWDGKLTFTDHLRGALSDAGWRKGKPLTFYLRMKTGKRKKVRGRFQHLSHVPGKGFFITLDRVHWLGSYCGSLPLRFPTKHIEWDEHFATAFAGAMEIARQRMPRLEAGTPP